VKARFVGALLMAAAACLAGAANGATVEPGRIDTADGPRSYLLARPEAAITGPRPLVILLHGHGGSAALTLGRGGRVSPLASWLAIADRERILVAAPDGAVGADRQRGWHDCRRDARNNPATDDVGFIAALVRRLVDQGAADPSRIYAMGMSNGGMMTFRLALELDPPLAAFAAASSSMAADSLCGPARRPVSALLIAGTDDPLVPFNGGGVGFGPKDRGAVVGIEAAADFWRRADGIGDLPIVTALPHREASDPTRVTVELWGDNRQGPQVELVRIDGGGHVEPSLNQHYGPFYGRMVGRQNRDLEAAEEAWRFFRDKRAAP